MRPTPPIAGVRKQTTRRNDAAHIDLVSAKRKTSRPVQVCAGSPLEQQRPRWRVDWQRRSTDRHRGPQGRESVNCRPRRSAGTAWTADLRSAWRPTGARNPRTASWAGCAGNPDRGFLRAWHVWIITFLEGIALGKSHQSVASTASAYRASEPSGSTRSCDTECRGPHFRIG